MATGSGCGHCVDPRASAAKPTLMSAPLKLFIKAGCPWCDMAEEWLQAHGYRYAAVDVRSDAAAFAEMKKLSGQQRAPTLQAGEAVLADFGPEELAPFLKRHSISPDAAPARNRRD